GLDWEITENYLIEATSFILFRKAKRAPTQISLELRTDPTSLNYLILLLKLLQKFNCKICIDDIYSWRSCVPASKEILGIICNDNTSVRLKTFRGCIENVDILPTSLEKLSLSIICTDQPSGNDVTVANDEAGVKHVAVADDGTSAEHVSFANDPGISKFSQNFNILGQL
ncbi:unnamed protein product, partial [Meganyctiphanes norvegica]